MPFQLADLLCVAALSLDKNVVQSSAGLGFSTIEDVQMFQTYLPSGDRRNLSVVLASTGRWIRATEDTVVCPRSAGGLIAQYILEKTGNLDMAYAVVDYDPILESKFPSTEIRNRVLLERVLSMTGGAVAPVSASFTLVKPSDPYALLMSLGADSAPASGGIPSILPILLASSDANEVRRRASVLFPNQPRALGLIVGAVQQHVGSDRTRLEEILQSSIDLLQFSPWKDKVDDLRAAFGKRTSGGGLTEDQKEALADLLDSAPVLAAVGNIVILNYKSLPGKVRTEMTKLGVLPDTATIKDAANELQNLKK